MKRISAETERKLMAVIEKTAANVSQGMSPNDAIVKAASDGQLRPGEVSLVVHAYNTGRTTRQRQDGHDPFEKSAEFELADTAAVLEAMYPTQVKTAAARHADEVISPEYAYSPAPMLERKTRCEKRAGQAVDWRTLNGATITAPPPLPTDPNHRLKMAMAKVDRLRTSTEEYRRKAASAFDQLGQAFMDLTTYFQRPDSHPLPVVKEAVILMHGTKGERLMDELVKVTPQLTKLANHRTGQSLLGQNGRAKFAVGVEDLDCTDAPFPLVATVMQRLDDYATKQAEYETANSNFEKEAGETIRPFVQPVVSESILGPSSDDQEKYAFDMTDPLKALGTYSLVNRTVGPAIDKIKGDASADPYQSKSVGKVMNSLNDPNHEARLREINTQAMLQDLMLNDPVISGYSSPEVTGAFNDIVQISPSVADQRMLIASLLRKKLQQGQLDTFEQDQLLGFEGKLRQQFQPLQPGRADGSVI